MGLWTMLFGGASTATERAEGEACPCQPDKMGIAKRLRVLQPRCGRYARFVPAVVKAIETGIGPNGRQSTYAEQARALFVLSKLLKQIRRRRVAVEVSALWMELNLLAQLP